MLLNEYAPGFNPKAIYLVSSFLRAEALVLWSCPARCWPPAFAIRGAFFRSFHNQMIPRPGLEEKTPPCSPLPLGFFPKDTLVGEFGEVSSSWRLGSRFLFFLILRRKESPLGLDMDFPATSDLKTTSQSLPSEMSLLWGWDFLFVNVFSVTHTRRSPFGFFPLHPPVRSARPPHQAFRGGVFP